MTTPEKQIQRILRKREKAKNPFKPVLRAKWLSKSWGITWHKNRKKFQLHVREVMTRKILHLGFFTSVSSASIARNSYYFKELGPCGLLQAWWVKNNLSKNPKTKKFWIPTGPPPPDEKLLQEKISIEDVFKALDTSKEKDKDS